MLFKNKADKSLSCWRKILWKAIKEVGKEETK